MLPKPATPHIRGSMTPWTKAQAIAASTALPQARRISAPASAASGCRAGITALAGGTAGSLVSSLSTVAGFGWAIAHPRSPGRYLETMPHLASGRKDYLVEMMVEKAAVGTGREMAGHDAGCPRKPAAATDNRPCDGTGRSP